jgi:signal transduction histidine kinase
MNPYQDPSPIDRNIFWIVFPPMLFAAVFGAIRSGSLLVEGICFFVACIAGVPLFLHMQWMRKNVGTLQKSDVYSSKLMEVFDDALIIYTPDFVITHFNPAAERLFSVKMQGIIGRKVSPQDVQNPSLARLAQTIFPSLAPVMVPESQPGAATEIISLMFQDPELDLRVLTSPIRGERGVEAFIKVIRDKTAELSMLKSKDEFITVASHQLRTPLTEVSWGLENLVSDASLSPESRTVAESTLMAVKGVIKMAEDLLNMAKIEEGRYGYKFEPLDLELLVNGILEQILPITKHAGLTLYFDRSATALPHVIADPKKISIAITNLLENAIRYNIKGGQVTIKTELLPGQPFVRLSVKDTGIGIPPDDQKKLFSKFFRAENAIKSQTRGSGFGLYITKNIIRAHGGQIEVRSEINRGTLISITIPTDPKLVLQKEIPLMGDSH